MLDSRIMNKNTPHWRISVLDHCYGPYVAVPTTPDGDTWRSNVII